MRAASWPAFSMSFASGGCGPDGGSPTTAVESVGKHGQGTFARVEAPREVSWRRLTPMACSVRSGQETARKLPGHRAGRARVEESATLMGRAVAASVNCSPGGSDRRSCHLLGRGKVGSDWHQPSGEHGSHPAAASGREWAAIRRCGPSGSRDRGAHSESPRGGPEDVLEGEKCAVWRGRAAGTAAGSAAARRCSRARPRRGLGRDGCAPSRRGRGQHRRARRPLRPGGQRSHGSRRPGAFSTPPALVLAGRLGARRACRG
jgi:hypothetical protein